jgi:dTDP-4-dehydrorhamnose reductase
MTGSILVFGYNGNLGGRLIASQFKNHRFISRSEIEKYLGKLKLDVMEFSQLDSILNFFNPDVVINCAGISDVEYCELNSEHCKLVNMVAPTVISDLTKKRGIKLVHISTDHFLSKETNLRDEDCTYFATNIYGYSKLNADLQIQRYNKDALIIRTNFFGYGRNNLVKWAIDKVDRNETLDGFIDISFNPVSIGYLCHAIESLLNCNASGILNVTSDESITKYSFLSMVARAYSRKEISINKIKASDKKLNAVRPGDMALLNKKFKVTTESVIPVIADMIQHEISTIQRRQNGFIEK